MKYPEIQIEKDGPIWRWTFTWVGMYGDREYAASGTSLDYHQACECARIAWEQHSHE